ncbi:3-oxo-5-alpha-steroid 4-dehydrogenase-domain-containing protein [Crassisporium funariophilum]|nr:3-oxo-5-alpha-steroid 4-dehydrogenase-domain-containing protein [Crassisporium funariophilum]
MVSLTVSSASKPSGILKRFPLTIEVMPEATIADVKANIAADNNKLYPSRQKITLKGDKKACADETRLSSLLGVNLQGGELQLKDLGAQISWRTVFIVEYIGPLIIHPLFYHFPRFWYGQDVKHSALQKYVYAFVMLHFIKRELETIFVHRFSHGTMPWFNIIKNSGHYHILSGLFLALDMYRSKFSATSPYILNTIRNNEHFLWICAGIWAFAELSNLHTHLTLRSLRPEGTRKRAIPRGYGFNLVSCPNYLFESMTWAVVWVMTGSVAAFVFLAVAAGTMTVWALKKQKIYKKEFGKEFPRGRKAIIPFIL